MRKGIDECQEVKRRLNSKTPEYSYDHRLRVSIIPSKNVFSLAEMGLYQVILITSVIHFF